MRILLHETSVEATLAMRPEWFPAGTQEIPSHAREVKALVSPLLAYAGIDFVEGLLPVVEVAFQPGTETLDASTLQVIRTLLLLQDLLAVAALNWPFTDEICLPLDRIDEFLKTNFESLLSTHAQTIRDAFLEDGDLSTGELDAVEEQFQHRQFAQAMNSLAAIDRGALPSEATRRTRDRYEFLLKLRMEHAGDLHRGRFEQLNDTYAHAGDFRARLCLDYVRYLDDIREHRLAGDLLKQFDRQFPLWLLGPIELACYRHIEGRNQYYRGNFIEALTALDEAAQLSADWDEDLFASVCNTTANAYADNLFFDAGERLATQAWTIRERTENPRRFETLSLMGQLAFRQGQHALAERLLQRVEDECVRSGASDQELNRVLNYRAKVALASKKWDQANALLERAEALKANIPEKAFSFTHLYRLFWLCSNAGTHAAQEFYRSCWERPGQSDPVTQAWAQARIAQSLFCKSQGKDEHWESAVALLKESIGIFSENAYIVEAAWVSVFPLMEAKNPAEVEAVAELFSTIHPNPIAEVEAWAVKHAALPERFFGILFDGATIEPEEGVAHVASRLRQWLDGSFHEKQCLPQLQSLISSLYLY